MSRGCHNVNELRQQISKMDKTEKKNTSKWESINPGDGNTTMKSTNIKMLIYVLQ